jgi:hypothetical protein
VRSLTYQIINYQTKLKVESSPNIPQPSSSLKVIEFLFYLSYTFPFKFSSQNISHFQLHDSRCFVQSARPGRFIDVTFWLTGCRPGPLNPQFMLLATLSDFVGGRNRNEKVSLAFYLESRGRMLKISGKLTSIYSWRHTAHY